GVQTCALPISACASHLPSQVPAQVSPPALVALPSHLPSHLPPHLPLKPAEQEPEQVPLQEPEHSAPASTVHSPSHLPPHWPLISPPSHCTSAEPGETLASQEPAHSAIASIEALHFGGTTSTLRLPEALAFTSPSTLTAAWQAASAFLP